MEKLTPELVQSIGFVLLLTVWSIVFGVSIILGRAKTMKVRVGSTEVSTGESGEPQQNKRTSDETRDLIRSMHNLLLVHTDAIDVILQSLEGSGNGEVKQVRRELRDARKHYGSETVSSLF